MEDTIQADYDSLQGEREPYLKRARECAALTIPTLIQETPFTKDSRLIEPYQNIGSDGISGLSGRLTTTLFPAGLTFYRLNPSAKMKADPDITPDGLEAVANFLYMRELLVKSLLDGTNFRTKMRVAIQYLLVAGNSLIKIDDDYQLRVFHPESYVQTRDHTYSVTKVITKECIDPLSLPAKMRAVAMQDVKDEDSDEDLDLYTRIVWNRTAKGKLDGSVRITQECNGHIINESREAVSPYFVAGYDELTGGHYSRSFAELKLGSLRSTNSLAQSMLEGAAAVSKLLAVYDATKRAKARDLTLPSGSVVEGSVENGVAQGYGLVTTQKSADLNVAHSFYTNLQTVLARSMMLEAASQPTGERVTATQIGRIAAELEGALGGVYAQIAEELQRPFLMRVLWQMKRDKLYPVASSEFEKEVELQVLTGIEALGRQQELDKLLAGIQTLAQFPGGLDRLKMQVVAMRVLTRLGIDISGLLKSDAELEKERQAAIQQQNQLAMGQEAAKAAGNVATEVASQYASAQAQPTSAG